MWKSTGKVITGITRALSGDSISSADEEKQGSRRKEKILDLVSNVHCRNFTDDLKDYNAHGNLAFRGAMCDFYKCTLPSEDSSAPDQESTDVGPKVVVVKKRQMRDRHDVDLPGCCEELLLWSSLRHENILPMLGYILFDFHSCPALVAEWTPNGTVDKYLALHPQTDLVVMSHGIAKALAYTHSKGIIHGNVKTGNVLVASDGRPLLSGFTLSTWPEMRKARARPRKGTMDKHRAGGYWRGELEADVWAYGMTVVEMLELALRGGKVDNRVQLVSDILRGSEDLVTGKITDDKYEALRRMCQACWHPDNDSIPSMEEIVKAFDGDRLTSLDKLAIESHLRRTLLGYREADLTGKIVQLEEYNRNHGGFSDVYYGRSTMHNKLVAIKRVRYRLHDDLQFIKRMVRELQIWARLNHKNVLSLLGYTVDGGLYYLSLITEWMSNGTALQYLRAKGEGVDLLYMVQGIAAGLEYLHSRDIVHSDMKSGNVLISEEGEPLVTDFGISHMLSSSTVAPLTTGTYGTVRWMAYEQINIDDSQSSTPYTFQTDVWSFGMTILELLTLDVPYAYLLLDQQVTIAIYKGNLPQRPRALESDWNEERGSLWSICESCWNLDPTARPSMNTILLKLFEIRGFDALKIA